MRGQGDRFKTVRGRGEVADDSKKGVWLPSSISIHKKSDDTFLYCRRRCRLQIHMYKYWYIIFSVVNTYHYNFYIFITDFIIFPGRIVFSKISITVDFV